MTAPRATPLFIIKQAIRVSRRQLEAMVNAHQQSQIYSDQQLIGKSHKLVIVRSQTVDQPTVTVKNRHIIVNLSEADDYRSNEIQRLIQESVLKVIRKEAKAYLGRRLSHLASRHNFSYSAVRYTHAGSRWGSCSSQGNISLNIALMKLPLDLIDYVLIHELCHTKQMNHSTAFWQLVADCLPNYKKLRQQLKAQTPSL